MEAITLKPHLQEILESSAEEKARSVNDLVNEAVEQYLEEWQLSRLDREVEAYGRLYPTLRQSHMGHWIAVHNGQMVDDDENGVALSQRVRQRYGRTPVLIRQVTEQVGDEIWSRTPATGRVVS